MTRNPEPTREILAPEAIPGMVLPDLARWMAEEARIFNDDAIPFKATLHPGDARVLLITGANASGKSLAFRLIAQLAADHKIEALTLSIRERTGAGTFEMAHMRRTMIYGREESSSTGATSARVVETGFHNLSNRGPAILALDEPEMGLSDGYARALGEFIGQSALEMSGKACGVVVVTHSRPLVRGLQEGLKAAPTHLAMDAGISSLSDWLEHQEHRSVADLLALPEVGHAGYKAVQAILNERT